MACFDSMLSEMSEFKLTLESIQGGKCPVHITGMTGSQKSHFIYALCKATGKKCFVITYDEAEAGRISHDLSFLFSHTVLSFQSREYVFYDVEASTHVREISRLKAIGNLANAEGMVSTVEAAMRYTMPKDIYQQNIREFKIGDTLDSRQLSEQLLYMGYRRVSMVEGVGQFCMRGSIIDIFSPMQEKAVRIDLFGDEVDSMREFDVRTQISTENINTVLIGPVRELLLSPEKAKEIAKRIREMKNENLLADSEKFMEYRYFSSLDKYMPFIYDKIATILDYISDDYLIFLDEAKMAADKSKTCYDEQNGIITDMLEKGLFPRTKKSYILDYSMLLSKINPASLISISSLSHLCPEFSPKALIGITAKTLQNYGGKAEFLYEDLKYWKKTGYRVLMVLSSAAKVKSMLSALLQEGIEAAASNSTRPMPLPGQIYIIEGSLNRGFEYPTLKTVVVSDGETMQAPKKKKRLSKANSRDVIKSFEDLQKGDYVVHRTHGIGRYVGIAQLVVDNVTKDYLKISYKSNDFLYVPTNQLDFLHKYAGGDTHHVKVNSLGGGAWNKTVSRVKESVAELAEDLIKLYAQRSAEKGHVFPTDTPWQKEFEEKFIYEETPDQLRCIAEVKEDMEQGKCMDRLLCGDVGYGKTEVAIRAAFKCVMEGMQVAYLVPTTILAQQHYNNFCARMEEYAMKVEMLSRFRTKKAQQKIITELGKGSVDVVIGTHRIIQKDVKFKNLGLLIIDEEQRFGVNHKERLKELKKDVDVLTLSATPIPRTLNMAMVGIRDLSVISAPPSDRYPVQTFVMEYNEAVVQNAIERELARNGQVYYLFNRVEGIERIAAKIQSSVPDARVAVAHGKMTENQLEEIMMSLLEGEIDVLVCTTIIETGLDVSNVNTIIIENADCLGLSQLYQLRGRVGRSNRLAYAYLTYNPGKTLDSVAHKRLQAIREYTEFGSGFKIAMRDLEIRGAGNLLGKQQHGNMNLVGYDMYCMLLEQAVKEIRGEEYKPPLEVTVELHADAFIPSEYIEYEQQRIDMYKKIALLETEADYYELQEEFLDRFGDLPQCVINLLDVSYIKSLCRICEISEVTQSEQSVSFTFTDHANPEAVVRVISEYEKEMKFISGAKTRLLYQCKTDVIHNIKIVLQKMLKTIQEAN